MDDLLTLNQVSFAYRGAARLALDRIDFSVAPGEFIAIAGATGAGKSTLLRAASGIVPKFFKGPFKGKVRLDRKDIAGEKVADLAGQIGTLFQDFESQLFSTNARLELAFGMENLGLDRETMKARIDRVARLIGLERLLDREPQSLSGGQKQRLALGSVLCLEPKLLLCDEPTTDLDPIGKQEVFEALDRLAEAGHAVVLAGHEPERMIQADRIAIINQGRLLVQGPPGQVLADPEFCRQNGLFPPQLFDLFFKLGLDQRPMTVGEAKSELEKHGFKPGKNTVFEDEPEPGGSPLIEVRDLSFSYQPGQPILHNISLEIKPGDFVALLGQNGSGKTTLLKHFNALLDPDSGQALFNGRSVREIGPTGMGRKVGFVFQNPDHMLFAANVFEEVAFGLRNLMPGADPAQIKSRVSQALETVGLTGMEESDPFILTKGQRQKLAVACVLACEPEVLILDEPTTGLDANEQTAMMGLLQGLRRAGHTIIIVTHTLEAALAYARRVILIDEGRILADGTARDIFHQPDLLSKTNLTAPPAVHLSAKLGLKALTVDELAAGLERSLS